MNVFFAWALIIIFLLMSLLMAVKPYAWWAFETLFTLKEGEPTDFYLTVIRIRGVVGIIIAVVCVWLLYR